MGKMDTNDWKRLVLEYQKPSFWRATWQIINTLGSVVVLWYMMFLSLNVSYWLTAPLILVQGMMIVRVFIIFHDCGHGSYFKSKIANDVFGFITGLLTFTPYHHWRWEHSVHHANSGHLDKRGVGDIWTMTVREYLMASRWRRFAYRMTRNPFILFVIAPLYLFLVHQRFPKSSASMREKLSVYIMNLAIIAKWAAMSSIFGWKTYLVLQLLVTMVAGGAGVWMFYIQHQFEDVYWERGEKWDYTLAALQGSSFYKLPKLLQWFTGNIGFHHIHHLSPRIPNYNLQRCHEATPLFQKVQAITFLASLKSFKLRLWDEDMKKLVGYDHLRNFRKQQQGSSPA